MRQVIASVAAIALLWLTGVAAAKDFTYVNDRFGTTATFPVDVFSEQMPPPENGDGSTWLSADGASIAIYGSNNALEQTPDSMLADAKARKEAGYELTYGKAGKDWVVLSGFEAGVVFYQRLEFGADDVIHGLLVKYPPALKTKYDPLVGPIAASLSGP